MSLPHDPAFPYVIGQEQYCDGMTVREYFAAKAMQGLVASELLEPGPGENVFDGVALDACRFADALLAELAKPKE